LPMAEGNYISRLSTGQDAWLAVAEHRWRSNN
jgi:hypothetical protein